jgi:hypothetical protein
MIFGQPNRLYYVNARHFQAKEEAKMADTTGNEGLPQPDPALRSRTGSKD